MSSSSVYYKKNYIIGSVKRKCEKYIVKNKNKFSNYQIWRPFNLVGRCYSNSDHFHNLLFKKMFIDKNLVDSETMKQIRNMIKHPSVEHVRIMPDCHKGSGCCIGFTNLIKNGMHAEASSDGQICIGPDPEWVKKGAQAQVAQNHVEFGKALGFGEHFFPTEFDCLKYLGMSAIALGRQRASSRY